MTARVERAFDRAALSLYVHLPWCARKCPYCDFNSFEKRGALPESAYVAALLRDLAYESAALQPRTLTSIYIGGGTPSLFSAEQIARLIDGIRATLTVSDHAEITLEANPGTLEADRFVGFRQAGVNRVSIGVQSLRDTRLKLLGRVHTARNAIDAVGAALSAGFDSVNLDLMYGLPGDGVADGLSDLKYALALGTAHLSWYQLTLEPNTVWERQPPAHLPQDDEIVELERAGREMLAAAGFDRYEVSAYAKPGHICVHNRHYWCFGDYVGIGAGAHSKLRASPGDGHIRYSRLRNPSSYMARAGSPECIEATESVSEPRSIALEYLMNALRLVDGTAATDFEALCGVDRAVIAAALQEARSRGLMSECRDRMCATEKGFNQINSILRLVC